MCCINKLTIIGDGPERQKLAKFVKVNGLSVSFLGRLSHEKVVSELRKHGIYLHTSGDVDAIATHQSSYPHSCLKHRIYLHAYEGRCGS